jgi:mRNA interferase MazF
VAYGASLFQRGRLSPPTDASSTVGEPAVAGEFKFSTVICAPVYSRYDGLSTQVEAGLQEGLKHESSIHCDELVSLPKTMLTRYVGQLAAAKIKELDQALAATLDL